MLFERGEPIKPKSLKQTVRLKSLKPQKLYTVIINNKYEEASVEVHNYVFQTSRYENFTQQVESYILDEQQGIEAIFDISHPIEQGGIETAFGILGGDPRPDSLAISYPEPLESVLQGLLGLPIISDPETTEFNWIINSNTNERIALLIRNPEPFNDPKIPENILESSISVLDVQEGDFQILLSSDASQALIMHRSHRMPTAEMRIKFEYKKWNGKNYSIEKSEIVTLEA